MKTLKLFSITALFTAVSMIAVAQTKTETFKVSGNCGMCKSKIEKAAKGAGATTAIWNAESKDITVTYNSSETNTAKIQQKIADVGYDNVGFKAVTTAYNKLPGCCKYVREEQTEPAMDCCKDGKCTKEGHDGKDCCKKTDMKMDCCKDGKCTKEGHDGKDCCKKDDEHKEHNH
jgi:periplasmic mercuric ion binding protein